MSKVLVIYNFIINKQDFNLSKFYQNIEVKKLICTNQWMTKVAINENKKLLEQCWMNNYTDERHTVKHG